MTASLPAGPRQSVRLLTLQDALRIGLANNREYQSQKEQVYLSALAFSLSRWQFAPRFFGLVSGDLTRDGSGEVSGSVDSDFGWNWLFASGARLSVSLASHFFQFFTGDRMEAASSVVSAAITQPLLRGFGSHIVLEPVTQAERNVVYQLRSFERFRQTFGVEVARQYYRALEARSLLTNEYLNWQGLVNNLDRARAMNEGGRLPRFEVDQVLQQELQARNRYAVAVEDFESSLDRFKITLGFPITAAIGLDESEFERLQDYAAAAVEVEIDVEDALAAALRSRLDLTTVREQVEDSERRIAVAADALRAQLDISASANLVSGARSGAQTPLKINSARGVYGVGLNLDLPFDRRAERNAYAAAIISFESEKRSASLFEDSILLTVRDSHRRFVRERHTYRIQAESVPLAQVRVESTIALREAGRAETRDILDSQRALIETKNALTSSLINLTLARLEFYRDTGLLRLENDGRLVEDPIPRRVSDGP